MSDDPDKQEKADDKPKSTDEAVGSNDESAANANPPAETVDLDESANPLDLDDLIEFVIEEVDEEEEMEAEADALLGGEDATLCSYDQGYRARQPLYSCRTCAAESGREVGVCLACSYECHADHHLIELYTKRRFKCDCGNQRCPKTLTCKLCPVKQADNDLNAYNHNFTGVYCTCERPYPDEEDDVNDEMVQCVGCEDWYHTRHLNEDGSVTADEIVNEHEVCCRRCVNRLPILKHYAYALGLALQPSQVTKKVIDAEDTADDVQVVEQVPASTTDSAAPVASSGASPPPPPAAASLAVVDSGRGPDVPDSDELPEQPVAKSADSSTSETSSTAMLPTPTPVPVAAAAPAVVVNGGTEEAAAATLLPTVAADSDKTDGQKTAAAAADPAVCKLAGVDVTQLPDAPDAVYWLDGWRDQLCQCQKCIRLYERFDCEYLVDPADPVAKFMADAKAKVAEDRAKHETAAAEKLPGLAPSTSGGSSGATATDGFSELLLRMMNNAGVDRVGQVEVMHRVEELKTHLATFLVECRSLDRPIDEDDVREFFNRRLAKRRRLNGVPPDLCHQGPTNGGFL